MEQYTECKKVEFYSFVINEETLNLWDFQLLQ